MTAVTDMSTPVTRGELREELSQLEQRIDGKLDQLEHRIDGKLDQLEQRIDGKLDQLEHKFDHKLEFWGGALLRRIEQSEKRSETRFAEMDKRFLDMEKRFVESEKRLSGELARHAQAICESVAAQISVVDEKYGDLPGRVGRLEADVQLLKQR